MAQWVKALLLIPRSCKVDRTDFCKLLICRLHPCYRGCTHVHIDTYEYMHTHMHTHERNTFKKEIWNGSK